MKSVFVYCEVENQEVAEISQELLSAGKRLAQKLGCPLDAMLFGKDLNGIESQISPYGVDKLFLADDKRLEPYRTLPHAALAYKILKEEDPQIVLFGATSIGRDLAPRLASKLNCGLTADTTILDIGDHFVKQEKKEYKDLLYAIRPAFGGSIMANIINWDMHPQMATVREGVMKKEIFKEDYKSEIISIDPNEVLKDEDFVVEVIARQIEESSVNLKEAPIIVAGTDQTTNAELAELKPTITPNLSSEGSATYMYYITDATTGVYVDSVALQFNYTLSIEDQILDDLTVSIAPNPATDIITIKTNNTSNSTIKMVDVLGNVVLNETSFNQTKKIDVSNFRNGIYFVKVESEGSKAITRKVVVRH